MGRGTDDGATGTADDGWPATGPWTVAVARADEAPVGDRWLTPVEREACAGLATGAARADYRAARLAARRAVARLGAAPLALALSHRLGRAAAVATAARGVRVGVDLEVAGSVPPERARYFLTRYEREVAAGRVEFAALWALKEAAWKALDVRDTVCFSALELVLDVDTARLTAVALHGERYAASAALSAPWPGFVLAVVCVAGDEAR